MDAAGNAVTLTMTIGEGSGIYIPGTGIHMNNMLGEASLQPEGLHTWLPDSRLNSMMAPTIVQDVADEEVMLLGSGGASRIPFMLSQVIDNVYNHDMNLQQSIEAPRVHFEHDVFQVESSKYPRIDLYNGHTIRHWNEMSLFFGGVHAIRKHHDVLEAYGDRRRHGREILE